ncbi:putative zinc metalloprotease [Elsinoe ampelina]|uniref:Putative zinc metalloprotease n=1 Tax=Elsinoe ampelina TaxID=302913 RepID=A0A6A6G904_9PEZI|nr:putative zinc metalloprotease [Elsinoe ampelina]
MSPAAIQSHFRLIQRFDLDYAPISVTQYESSRTGMRVVVASQEGPKVYGYFTLATEIHDDSGSPHTLEHLCFMGSKSYRYKGILDKLATRVYSNTNAWTATDHTAYTLETAGWDGFASILPVYLEHVLVPTLTDAGCYTEVHHIDGNGRDAGVVYSEMQGVQNTQSELMELESKRTMYPEGNGFRYETGGMMENLRVLTADRIRAFHKEMYQPKNLSLVLLGQIDQQQLLRILDEFEETILDDVPPLDAPFKRPWVDSSKTPALTGTTIKTVEFPEEDESTGEILISFLGPNCNNALEVAAVNIVLMYLAESSASVLENKLVEKEHLCTGVYYYSNHRPETTVEFTLSAVKTSKLADVEKRFFEILKEVASNELDMNYVHDSIRRQVRQQIFRSENSAESLATDLIGDHLFGSRSGSDLKRIKDFSEYDELLSWSDRQWRDFFSKWFSDAYHVSILGVPSKKLSDKLKAEEQARVKAQQEKFGEEGSKRLTEKLEQAKAENDKPIPDSILSSFEVPDTSSIHFIRTTTARAGLAKNMGRLDNDIQRHIDADDHDLPLFLHFEHIPSKFVRMKLVMSTGPVPTHLKPLISLYIYNFFATPIMRDGKKISFEDVVMELERDTVGFAMNYGPSHSELLQVTFEVEQDKYATAIKWIRTMLYDFVFDEERLLASLTKILADIPDEKRSGSSMNSATEYMVEYKRDSIVRATSTLVKAKYLRRIKAKMLKEPQEVIKQLNELVAAIHQPSNYRAYVAADLTQLTSPVSTWRSLLEDKDTSKSLRPLEEQRSLLTESGLSPGNKAIIVPLATVDSSFARFVVKGPDSHAHPDLPAIMVAASYLDAVEGPLWVAVRGTGLAYGSGFNRSLGTGTMTYRIWRSPESYKAFEASKEQITGLASGRIQLDKLALEGAISSIVQGFADEQPTAANAAAVSFSNQVIRGIGKDYNDEMLKKVRDVSADQVKDVLSRYFSSVFDPTKTNMYITCATIMQEDLVKNFKEAGFQVEVKQLADLEDDYDLEPVEGEDELDDDDEDDDDEDMDYDEDDSEEDA